ncbi:toprim domain-containing protein [Mycoplasmopsis lipofaciens]|uniref:toprim domain-containing protein n=1 Tax=Mycoplasmopsis lipofaciens TaxID=114884 RepID=UPI00048551B9|nr:toprim domain-containing protein [Mycoplasmopsis lipofaciens]
MKIETIEKLNKKFNTIPGISKKQANKMTNFLLNSNDEYIDELIELIKNVKNNISYCEQCHFLKEFNICLICNDKSRYNILMVVENATTIKKFEEIENFYHGYYYALPFLLNLKDQLNNKDYKYQELIDFVKAKQFDEIIIVLSPTLEGEATTTHLIKLLELNKFKATRAAIGLPMGSNIYYLDSYTIRQSIKNRNNK